MKRAISVFWDLVLVVGKGAVILHRNMLPSSSKVWGLSAGIIMDIPQTRYPPLWHCENLKTHNMSGLNWMKQPEGCDIQTCLVWSCPRLTTGSISPRWRCLAGRFSLPARSTQFGQYTMSLCTLPIRDYGLHMLLEHGRQPDCHGVNLKEGQITSLQIGLLPSGVPTKTHPILLIWSP